MAIVDLPAAVQQLILFGHENICLGCMQLSNGFSTCTMLEMFSDMTNIEIGSNGGMPRCRCWCTQ